MGEPAAPAGAGDGGMMPAVRMKHLRRSARSYADMLVKARRLIEASQRHEDRMLAWSVVAMGAALFALPTILSAACPIPNARGSLVISAAPWAGGVLFGLPARIVGGVYHDADAFHFAGKLGSLEAMLVWATSSPAAFGTRLLEVMNDEDERLQCYKAKTARLKPYAIVLYYTTMVAFGLGVATVLWSISAC